MRVQDAETLQRLHPKEYLSRFLARGVRPDGRPFNVCRRVAVTAGSVSSADGSAMVRIGKTSVVAGVQCLVTYPTQAAPKEGFLNIGVSLSAICSPRYHAKRPSDEAAALAEFLTRTVTRYVAGAGRDRAFPPCTSHPQVTFANTVPTTPPPHPFVRGRDRFTAPQLRPRGQDGAVYCGGQVCVVAACGRGVSVPRRQRR